jgi:hypothetical protein
VEEGPAVGTEELKVSHLRPVDGRVIDLVQGARETVNQTQLGAEQALPTPSSALWLQRGSMPGPPIAGCWFNRITISFPYLRDTGSFLVRLGINLGHD